MRNTRQPLPSPMRFTAYAIIICTQAAVVYAFSRSSAFTKLSVGDVTNQFSIQAAAAASVPSERIALELEDRISIPTAPAERGLLLLDKVDNLISSPGDRSINQNILTKINLDVDNDVRWAKETPLLFESDYSNHAIRNDHSETMLRTSIEYEPISVTASTEESSATTTIAVRTKPSTPLLIQSDISLLREAVETYWQHLASSENNGASTKSRFTYQRKGNSEAHLSDIVRYYEQYKLGEKRQQQVSALVDKLLLDRVYPWVRDAFLSKEDESNGDLYVYDAIFIRYNATEAENIGAGQPLHRDLGYVSVNIMLNSQDEFKGGGTFFENQLLPVVLNEGGDASNDIRALKPLGPGHAIAHFSSDRHAGSATFDGVRDILVLFVAVAAAEAERAPKWEVAARLKSTARAYCSDAHDDDGSTMSSIDEQLLCRVRHHRLAIKEVPTDGEAWHYLGMALLDYHNYNVAMQKQRDCTNNCSILRLAISCLEEATTYTPCDGRLLNNLGIARERLFEDYQTRKEETEMSTTDLSRFLDSLRGQVADALSRSIQIHQLCKQAGCDVNADYESACLNYGLFLSKLDDFEGAIDILSLVAANYEAEDTDSDAIVASRVLRDASNLLDFCKRQIH
mmetsp:Transcript_13158/g.21612  ORF Transcript_13158/g.21612 Transcript_13158/m.21612 type:complete len:626 (-) Transcript_13158:115-1992(-)